MDAVTGEQREVTIYVMAHESSRIFGCVLFYIKKVIFHVAMTERDGSPNSVWCPPPYPPTAR